jgi:imidazole glycerol-phosphate synthase subunit HisH
MKTSEVVVVDYGMGNVLSVCRAIERCGGKAKMSGTASDIAAAERLVLPGVGAFGDCMAALSDRGLIEPIKTFVATGRPFLGICVGMQILFDHGEEFGGSPGLGLIPGRVVQIATEKIDGGTRKIPHIGWAPVDVPADAAAERWSGSLFAATSHKTPFYFVHSFSARPQNRAHLLAVADYQGCEITAAVRRDNITGTQFHPEKSGSAGLKIITTLMAGEPRR